MSSARMTRAGGVPPCVMGEVEEQTWTTIAAEVDDVPQPDEVGKRMTTRRTHFAFKAEAETWVAEQEAQGWTSREGNPVPCATFYFGPTDAPSNCWSVEVSKEVK